MSECAPFGILHHEIFLDKRESENFQTVTRIPHSKLAIQSESVVLACRTVPPMALV